MKSARGWFAWIFCPVSTTTRSRSLLARSRVDLLRLWRAHLDELLREVDELALVCRDVV
jgi:hypothetical protein